MSIKLCIYAIISFYSLSLCAAQSPKLSPNPKPIDSYKALVDVMRERNQKQNVTFDIPDRKGPMSNIGGVPKQPNQDKAKG